MSTSTTAAARVGTFAFMRRFRADPFASFAQFQREHGDFIVTTVIPGLTNYLIFSPELTHEILVERAAEFQKAALGKRLLAGTFGNGLFFSEGEFWQRQRKLIQPALHHMRVRAYADQMTTQTYRMIDHWLSDPQPIDLVKAIRALTLTIVVEALFKTDVAGLTEEIGIAMGELGTALSAQTVNIVDTLMPDWIPTPVNRHKKRALVRLNPILYNLIAERRANRQDTGDLLSMFLNAVDEESGEQMTEGQIRDELMTMFIAGHETSATALSWALVELMRNPMITGQLRTEIDRVTQGRPVQLDDLGQLPLVQNVVKEALRLYPPVIFIARQAIQPLQIGRVTIPASALINLMVYPIQRDPRWYDQPEQFNPDRWTAEFEKQLPKCAYLPFGAGPRICVGNGFANLEMQLVLAAIIQRVDLKSIETNPIMPSFGIAMGFKTPVVIRPLSR